MTFYNKGLKLSLCVNVCLSFALAFWIILAPDNIVVLDRGEEKTPVHPQMVTVTGTSGFQVPQKYCAMSDDELYTCLFDAPEPLFAGFSSRDIALSMLYQRGYTIDLPLKSLGRWPQEMVSFEGGVLVFSQLSESDVEHIQRYLQIEKTPYSTKRLFGLLQQKRDASLQNEFLRREEWEALRPLLSSLFGSDGHALEYLLLFSWEGVQDHLVLVKALRGGDIDVHDRKILQQAISLIVLKDFARTQSPELAEIVLRNVPRKELLKADPRTLSILFEKLPPHLEQDGVLLAVELVKHPVRHETFLAAKKFLILRQYVGEGQGDTRGDFQKELEQKNQKKVAVVRKTHAPIAVSDTVQSVVPPPVQQKPSPSSKVLSQAAKEAISPFVLYTVRKGDTLWGVSKKFNVSVDKLRYLNRIKGKNLAPGTVLKIPKGQ